MKRKYKNSCLTPTIYGEYDEPKILDPIKLSNKDLKSLTVEVCGYTFIDTGYALACPDCGKISGVSCREDLDKKIDFFLKFGCEHYGSGSSDEE